MMTRSEHERRRARVEWRRASTSGGEHKRRRRRTALTPLLFSGKISVSSTYKLCHNHENVRHGHSSTLYITRTSMADPSLNRAGTASLLARDARHIARSRTQAHRTRIAALSMPIFFACVLHARSSSGGHQKVAMPYAPHARRRGRRSPRRCSSRRSS